MPQRQADRERKAGEEGEGGVAPTHRIRITLTSTKVKNLESVSSSLVQGAKEKGVKVKGPVRMPTRRLVHTTRRAPSGNGTNTFDRYEMRVHKRLIDLYSPADLVRQLTNLSLDPGVDIEVTIAD